MSAVGDNVELAFRYAIRSAAGEFRDANADEWYASERLLAVADGIGGWEPPGGGEVAPDRARHVALARCYQSLIPRSPSGRSWTRVGRAGPIRTLHFRGSG